ncbi:MAG: hybrid sensor histidine kinase/response regulator, partial [Betaproteobacteria bacterium]
MNLPLKDSEHRAVGHAEELTAIHDALIALRRGDRAAKLPIQGGAQFTKVADVFNDLVEQNIAMAEEIEKLAQMVGKEGKLKRRASLPGARGFWAQKVENINSLIDDLVHPTSEAARVIGAVAQGDLSQSMALEIDGRPLEGEFLRNAKTINKMVEQLGNFAAEVTRVAREVGRKDLTDNVNSMAGNLTSQVRNIADVTTAVAKGDLSKKIEVDVKGEFLTLKSTINTMVDQLRSFAAEVTRVAREVGTEGILGGQARVEGVSGTWKDLTDSVNSMAGNLTS